MPGRPRDNDEMWTLMRATCRNCGGRIALDAIGWYHLHGEDGTPCKAVPDERKAFGREPKQVDLFEVPDEP